MSKRALEQDVPDSGLPLAKRQTPTDAWHTTKFQLNRTSSKEDGGKIHEMKLYVDGGCRLNGSPKAYGAAAAIRLPGIHDGTEEYQSMPKNLCSHGEPLVTSQRAEIQAVVLALDLAWKTFLQHSRSAQDTLRVIVHADSRYSTKAMRQWIKKWQANGWKTVRNEDVSNRDLFEKAFELHSRLARKGTIKYEWIPRNLNSEADATCRALLTLMEEERKATHVHVHVHGACLHNNQRFQDGRCIDDTEGSIAAILTCRCGCGYIKIIAEKLSSDHKLTRERMAILACMRGMQLVVDCAKSKVVHQTSQHNATIFCDIGEAVSFMQNYSRTSPSKAEPERRYYSQSGLFERMKKLHNTIESLGEVRYRRILLKANRHAARVGKAILEEMRNPKGGTVFTDYSWSAQRPWHGEKMENFTVEAHDSTKIMAYYDNRDDNRYRVRWSLEDVAKSL